MTVFRLLFLLSYTVYLNGCFSSDSWTNSFFQKAIVATSISGTLGGVTPPSQPPSVSPEIVVEVNSIELVSGYSISIPSVDLNQTGDDFPITIRNIGNGPLSIGRVLVMPGSVGDWRQFTVNANSLSRELAPNESGILYVNFRPTIQASASASIYIENGDSDESYFQIIVKSSAAPDPDISVYQGNATLENGDSINLGGENSCGGAKTYSFTIQNLGLGTLNLTGSPKILISGPDASLFTMVTEPSDSSIPMSQVTYFSIRFSPNGALGERSATVTIPNDDPDESGFSFSFRTSQGNPEIYVYYVGNSEIPINSVQYLGYTYIHSMEPPLSFGIGIENLGNETLYLTGESIIEVSGNGASSFAFNKPISTIQPKTWQTFSVKAQPKNTGLNLANFSIPNNDCDENPYNFQATLRGFDVGGATPSWVARRGHTSVSFDNKLWVLGGAYRTNFYQDVYSSTDGVNWELKTSTAPWGKRAYHASVVFNNKIWVLGGNENNERRNDVWSSSDGVNWTREVESAPWTGRFEFGAVVFDNKIWVVAGKRYNDEGLRDVWYSSDGVNWTLATNTPSWSARSTFSLLTFQNKLWMIGGFSPTAQMQFKTVWNSSDGVNWTLVTGTPGWSPRSSIAGVVYNNAMYILSGFDGHNTLPDSYRSEDGLLWLKFESPWGARDTHTAVSWMNKIWVMGGQNSPGYPIQDVTSFWD